MKCRSCGENLAKQVIDLGFAPPSNAYLEHSQLSRPEKYYPLRVLVCESCWLVQTDDFLDRDEVFDSEYHYFSSTSASWVEHALSFVNYITKELKLDSKSFVVEVASNDGYLLQHFQALGVPNLGIEPTLSTAKVAISKGLSTEIEFFGYGLAKRLVSKYGKSDLLIGNNVFAHVPDLNDFTSGIEYILKPEGVCTLEFPHLLTLLQFNQFDTIYHEHFSYLSLVAIIPLLRRNGLRLFKIDKIQTHGGSLRVFICKQDSSITQDESVDRVLQEELDYGLNSLECYSSIAQKADDMKIDLLRFLISEKDAGRTVAGYGAAAKGNTFLNFAGVDSSLVSFVVDAAISKQSKFLPGSHIPILPPSMLTELKPDTVLVLPWNLASEVIEINKDLINSGTTFYVAVPHLKQI
jgi:hypothetical protein